MALKSKLLSLLQFETICAVVDGNYERTRALYEQAYKSREAEIGPDSLHESRERAKQYLEKIKTSDDNNTHNG